MLKYVLDIDQTNTQLYIGSFVDIYVIKRYIIYVGLFSGYL